LASLQTGQLTIPLQGFNTGDALTERFSVAALQW